MDGKGISGSEAEANLRKPESFVIKIRFQARLAVLLIHQEFVLVHPLKPLAEQKKRYD
jgi:hypothetical protein